MAKKTPKGRWVDDNRAKVTCPYGKPGAWAAGWHTGVDLAVPGSSGQRIVWANKRPGKVVRVGWDKSYGNMVIIRGAKGNEFLFAHMAQASGLKTGQTVRNGDLIGKIGSTGNVTGPHLHLEKAKGRWAYANVSKPPVWNGYR